MQLTPSVQNVLSRYIIVLFTSALNGCDYVTPVIIKRISIDGAVILRAEDLSKCHFVHQI